MRLRFELAPGDREAIGALVAATGFFSEEEVAIAVELVDERAAKGDASDYFFVIAEDDSGVLGYTCYGPTPATLSSYDLYWIAVDPRAQRGGVGLLLMEATEARIAERGGGKVWLDTSGRAQYAPTHGFYRRAGYRLAAELVDFYAPGDSKLIFEKTVPAGR